MTSVHVEEMMEACCLGKHRKMEQEQPEKLSGQLSILANHTVQVLNKCCTSGSQQITNHFILAGSEVLSAVLLDTTSSGTRHCHRV
jgi:hypothetical protein